MAQLIQQQIAAGKYQSALEVITAGVPLLEQQDNLDQGRLAELQQEVQVGWTTAQRGEVVAGPIAMAQIREKLPTRHDSTAA